MLENTARNIGKLWAVTVVSNPVQPAIGHGGGGVSSPFVNSLDQQRGRMLRYRPNSRTDAGSSYGKQSRRNSVTVRMRRRALQPLKLRHMSPLSSPAYAHRLSAVERALYLRTMRGSLPSQPTSVIQTVYDWPWRGTSRPACVACVPVWQRALGPRLEGWTVCCLSGEAVTVPS